MEWPNYLNEIPKFTLSDDQILWLESQFQSCGPDYKVSKSVRLGWSIQLAVDSKYLGRWWSARTLLEEGKPIRPTRKTPEQEAVLMECLYDVHGISSGRGPFPSKEAVDEMALETGLTYKQIKTWFVHMRTKMRESGELECLGDDAYTLNLPFNGFDDD